MQRWCRWPGPGLPAAQGVWAFNRGPSFNSYFQQWAGSWLLEVLILCCAVDQPARGPARRPGMRNLMSRRPLARCHFLLEDPSSSEYSSIFYSSFNKENLISQKPCIKTKRYFPRLMNKRLVCVHKLLIPVTYRGRQSSLPLDRVLLDLFLPRPK